jgi:hypothetical protein
VSVEPRLEVGDRARYRYEIAATINRSIDGAEPTTDEILTELVADQEVVAVSDDGAEAAVTLRREGAGPSTAQVLLDRSGAIRGIELVEGFSSGSLGLAELGPLMPPSTAPPAIPLVPGSRWSISEGSLEGHGRLESLGIVDGAEVAVVHTSVAEAVDDAVAAGTSAVMLGGELRADTRASYDLEDGSVRRSTARSHGDVRARIDPPAGVDAAPALATITYDIRVRVTRLA